MRKTYNIGVLGAGAMGRTHSWCVRNLDYFYTGLPFGAKLHTVCATTEESASRAAQSLGFERYTTSPEELICSPDIDVVDICTPNAAHFEAIKLALKMGKHIYCEKPLVISAEQAESLRPLIASRPELCLGVVFHNRFFPAIIRAKQLIDEGRLGRLLSFRCAYLHNSVLDETKPAGWKQRRDICGAGVLFDLGSHAIDLVTHLCGGVAEVQARTQIAFPTRRGFDGKEWETDAEEAVYILAKLENGACGTIEASKIAAGTNDDLTIQIYGTKGAMKFDLMRPDFLEFYDMEKTPSPQGGERGFTLIECGGRYEPPGGGFPSPKAPIGWLRAHLHSYYSYLDCLHRGVQPSPSFEDGMEVQRVMEWVLRASSVGQK